MYTGPNTVNDGLVFGYDTGYGVADYRTTTRFFKGAPTINYIHHQNSVAQSSYTTFSATSSGNWNANHPEAIRAYNAQGSELSYYVNQGVGNWQNTHHAHWQYDTILKKPVVVMNDVDAQWKAKSFGTGLGSWNSQGKTHGSTYTISWLQWVDNLSKNAKAGLYTKNSSGSSGFHDGQANSPSSYNTKLRTWQRVYQTYTTNSNRDLNQSLASIYMYGHHNVRATVKIADVQFTWGSTPFPFSAAYERSNTDSLIDLTKTSNINVSGVSFDSTGQPEFDGTDDMITQSRIINTANYSAEFVFKADVNTIGTEHWLGNQYAGPGRTIFDLYTNNRLRNFINGTSINGATTIETGTWYHAVFTRNSSGVAKIYLNGVQDATGTISSVTPSNLAFEIGGDTTLTGRWFNGKIPLCRVYNKALTAAEALQNYNAYKNRFNI